MTEKNKDKEAVKVEKVAKKNEKKEAKRNAKKATKTGALKKGKKTLVIVIIIVIIALVIGAVYFITRDKSQSVMKDFGSFFTGNNSTVSIGDSVSAYGVINIGTNEEALDVESMTTSLEIEGVLFETGDTVSEGDALVLLSESSVSAAIKELEKALREAELAYRAGAIEYEQSLITAKYDYDSTLLKGEQADEVYNETVSNLKSSLSSSTETYNKAVEELAEYKDASLNNTYYTEYKVEYYKNVYDENLEVLKTKMEEWGVSWSDVTSGGGMASGGTVSITGESESGSTGGSSTEGSGIPEGVSFDMSQASSSTSSDLLSQYKMVLKNLYSVLETNLKDYESALENYESNQNDLSYNLLCAELNMSTIEETYLNAKKTYETSLLTAEETRQTSKTNAELAESTYEATVEKAKTDYDSLLSAYESAKEDYDNFNACIYDNVYHATGSGTVMRTMARNNGTISAGGRILTYSDPSDATVTVSVDQSDIAKLSVGDTAICYASSTGMLNGTIVSISPVTQSSSISSVSYSVIVRLENDGEELSANTTVTVLFGADADSINGSDLSNLNSQNENSFDNMFESSSGPDSMPDFGGNMPDFGNMPNNGGR